MNGLGDKLSSLFYTLQFFPKPMSITEGYMKDLFKIHYVPAILLFIIIMGTIAILFIPCESTSFWDIFYIIRFEKGIKVIG